MEGVLLFGEFSRVDLTKYWVKMAGGAQRNINAVVFAFMLTQDMAVYRYFNRFVGVHILSKYDAAVYEKAIETAYNNKTKEGQEEEEDGSKDGVFYDYLVEPVDNDDDNDDGGFFYDDAYVLMCEPVDIGC